MATETIKARIDRVRKVLENGVKFCQRNDIPLTTGNWINSNHNQGACAIGGVFHMRGLEEKMRGVQIGDEVDFAAKELRISFDEVEAFVNGFDFGQALDFQARYNTRVAAFERLGAHFHNKYL